MQVPHRGHFQSRKLSDERKFHALTPLDKRNFKYKRFIFAKINNLERGSLFKGWPGTEPEVRGLLTNDEICGRLNREPLTETLWGAFYMKNL